MAANNKRSAKDLNNSVSSTPRKPSAKVVNEESLSKLFELVTQMNKKLDKLDTIETHLARVDKDIIDLKASYTFVNETTDELRKEQGKHNKLIAALDAKIAKLEVTTTTLKQDVVDLRSRSMRSNLVFYNLPEREKEEPMEIIFNLLEKKMGIEEPKLKDTRPH